MQLLTFLFVLVPPSVCLFADSRMDSLANGQSLTIKDEALLSLSLVQDIFSEKSKNVHVLSMALQVLRAAGILAGGKLRVIAQSIVILTETRWNILLWLTKVSQ